MKVKGYIITGVLLAVFLFSTLQRGSGALVVLCIPFFLAMAIYHGVRMIRRAGERRGRAIRMAVWSGALLLVSGTHLWRDHADRRFADQAAREVLEYRQRTGSYPANLAEAGLAGGPSVTGTKLRYAVRDGNPTLAYPATFMPLTTHAYDFDARRWRRNAH